jgi:ubiquinone/menaquinone biosynthesis C-methylase UbiE
MSAKPIPESIENDWNLLYRDYPEIYDRFASFPYQPAVVEVIDEHFHLVNQHVLEVGSGTGKQTFRLAQRAGWVTGVEPEASMRQVAIQEAERRGLRNVDFVAGFAERLPLRPASVDMVMAITLASLYNEPNIHAFVQEAERVTRPGGFVLALNIASGWYGGDLGPILFPELAQEEFDYIQDLVFPQHGYTGFDYFSQQDYGTVENAVQTYGFIFGMKTIEYLRVHQKSTITWKWRIYYRQIP